MSQAPKPRGLGRGLSALLGDEEVAAAVTPSVAPAPQQPAIATPARTLSRTPFTLPIAELRAGPFQPRTTFEGLESLIDSVRQYGLLQPILVRPIPHEANAYEIIAGERRWRAAQKAQLHEVPVVVRSFDNLEALQIALVENLQRTDLSPIDEAAGYRRLMSDFGQTQEEVAQTVGKSRPHVATCCACSICPRPCASSSSRTSCRPARRAACSPSTIPRRWLNARSARSSRCATSKLWRAASGRRRCSRRARPRRRSEPRPTTRARWRNGSRRRWD